MIDYDHWLDRIDNDLEILKFVGGERISTMFTERELRELRIVFSAIKEYEESKRNET